MRKGTGSRHHDSYTLAMLYVYSLILLEETGRIEFHFGDLARSPTENSITHVSREFQS